MVYKAEQSRGMNSAAGSESSRKSFETITAGVLEEFLSYRGQELLSIFLQIKEAGRHQKLADLEAELMEIQFALKNIHGTKKRAECLDDRKTGYEGLRHNFEKKPSAYNLIRTILEARRAGMLEQCMEFLESRIVYIP